MNNITALVDTVKNAGTSGWNSLKTIATFLNYVMHPSLVINALWGFTQAYAFWICLLIAMICALLSAVGCKKLTKFIPVSAIVYAIIKSVGAIL